MDMNPVVSTDKIMEQIVSSARLKRKERGIPESAEAAALKANISTAAGLYEYRYGVFEGGGISVIKKILSLIIRPAARPIALEQADFNRSILQTLSQFQLSMEGDEPDAAKCINESVVQHEKNIKNLNKRVDQLGYTSKVDG